MQICIGTHPQNFIQIGPLVLTCLHLDAVHDVSQEVPAGATVLREPVLKEDDEVSHGRVGAHVTVGTVLQTGRRRLQPLELEDVDEELARVRQHRLTGQAQKVDVPGAVGRLRRLKQMDGIFFYDQEFPGNCFTIFYLTFCLIPFHKKATLE